MDQIFATKNNDNQSEVLKKIIEIENKFSPIEIYQLLDGEINSDLAQWHIKRNINMMSMIYKQPRIFNRLSLSKNVNFYSTKANFSKSLLICFCGRANRLMLPISSFLQLIPDDKFDVLIFQDPSRKDFLQGIPGFSSDLKNLVKKIEDVIDITSYQDIRCLGTSGGAGAALYFGVLIEASAAYSIGGRHLKNATDFDRLQQLGFTGDEFDILVSDKLQHSKVKLYAFYAELEERDRLGALSLSNLLDNCQDMPVTNLKEHNIFAELLRGDRDQLIQFFDNYILS